MKYLYAKSLKEYEQPSRFNKKKLLAAARRLKRIKRKTIVGQELIAGMKEALLHAKGLKKLRETRV